MISRYDAHIVFRSLTIMEATEIAGSLEEDEACEDVIIKGYEQEPGAWYVYATASDIPAEQHDHVVDFCRSRWQQLACDSMWVMVVDV